MSITQWEKIIIADEALGIAYDRLAKWDLAENATTEEIQERMMDFPPSALLACLMAHAEYEGWDFHQAVHIASRHGAADCHEIMRNRDR